MDEYKAWSVILNTTDDDADGSVHQPHATMQAPPRSVIVFAGRP
jgi:glycogen operon protein